MSTPQVLADRVAQPEPEPTYQEWIQRRRAEGIRLTGLAQSAAQISRALHVSPRTVHRWRARARAEAQ